MSQTQLFTVHPDPEKGDEAWDSDLEDIQDFAQDRYGISENPYRDIPSVHPGEGTAYRTEDGEANNSITFGRSSDKDKERIVDTMLNRTPAEYVSLVHSSDHCWDANGWVYFREDGSTTNEAYFGEEDRQGKDVKREILEDFGVETTVPFF